MAIARAIVVFSNNRYSDSELNVKANTIVTNLIEIPIFLPLQTVAAEIKTINESFGSLLVKMDDGNKQVTIEKKRVRTSLEFILGSTALKVQDISGGDELIICSAGFEVKRKSAPIGKLDCPKNVEAKPGLSRGSLIVSWNVVPNTAIYELKYTLAPSTPSSVWLQASNTKSKMTIDNLTRGLAYAIQVTAAGSDPARVWSDEIISYVM